MDAANLTWVWIDPPTRFNGPTVRVAEKGTPGFFHYNRSTGGVWRLVATADDNGKVVSYFDRPADRVPASAAVAAWLDSVVA